MEIINLPDRMRNKRQEKEESHSDYISEDEFNSLSEESDIERSEEEIKPKIVKEKPLESIETTIDKDEPKIEAKREYKYQTSNFSSKEKENTIFILQILSAVFLVTSILFIFNYLNLFLYLIVGFALAAFILYLLLKKIKHMYPLDFPAYRDFFLMYIAVGIILDLISFNPFLMSIFSFQVLPSLSILIFAIISVAALFLIFRLIYHRDYTYGVVVEAGKKTAYVRIDYDIRANVKPDLYIVDNGIGAKEGEEVKLRVREKLLSSSGNKPTTIIKSI